MTNMLQLLINSLCLILFLTGFEIVIYDFNINHVCINCLLLRNIYSKFKQTLLQFLDLE